MRQFFPHFYWNDKRYEKHDVERKKNFSVIQLLSKILSSIYSKIQQLADLKPMITIQLLLYSFTN